MGRDWLERGSEGRCISFAQSTEGEEIAVSGSISPFQVTAHYRWITELPTIRSNLRNRVQNCLPKNLNRASLEDYSPGRAKLLALFPSSRYRWVKLLAPFLQSSHGT